MTTGVLRKLRRTLALALAVVMTVLCLGGCGAKGPTAISFGDVKITSNMFCYWMSKYKAMFLYSYTGGTTDNTQFWLSEMAEGVTIGDFLGSIAVSNIMSNAICLYLFDDYGLSLSNDELNAVETAWQTKITAAGSKSALNQQLSAFGVNADILKEIYIAETKISKLQDYLYGENGVEAATDAQINDYYQANYYHMKHLLVRTDSRIEKDADGNPIVDETTQAYKTAKLTDAEIEEQKKRAAEFEKDIAAGQDFDALVFANSEDTGMQYFEDGYYITSATTFLPSEVVSAVMQMKVGEVKTVNSSYGIHICKRYELEPGKYDEEPYRTNMFGDLRSTVNQQKMSELIGGYADLVVLNEDIIDDYPIAYCSPNFYF